MLRLCWIFALLGALSIHDVSAQNEASDGRLSRYMVQIDFPKAYLSGVYILREQGDEVFCSIVNEFGVSALTLKYDREKNRMRISNIIKQMDRFFIRKVLKADFKRIIPEMCGFDEPKDYKYINPRIEITYTFTALGQAPDA